MVKILPVDLPVKPWPAGICRCVVTAMTSALPLFSRLASPVPAD